ncbi:MAG: hypothetical protein JWM47_4595, partial [Acidimicrobiales bacterium]|nr:hypothetical protein [Acidimicrobiales bacterium]
LQQDSLRVQLGFVLRPTRTRLQITLAEHTNDDPEEANAYCSSMGLAIG